MADMIEFVYTNWRGETRVRKARPAGPVMFMATEHHPEPQWIMRAYDPEKRNVRMFALKDCDFTEAGIARHKALSDALAGGAGAVRTAYVPGPRVGDQPARPVGARGHPHKNR